MSWNSSTKRLIATALWLGLATAAPARELEEILKEKGVITSEEAKESQSAPGEKPAAAPTLPAWVGWITPFGDVRIRNEAFFRKGDDDRIRERFRLRFGFKVKPSDELELGFKLVSGNSNDPIS